MASAVRVLVEHATEDPAGVRDAFDIVGLRLDLLDWPLDLPWGSEATAEDC